jgi:hypothetical protein
LNATPLPRALALALLFASTAAQSQSVVVLEFRKDPFGRLRGQVERALKQSGSVEVVSLRRYKAAAAKRRLKGARAMTPNALAATAPLLKLSGAVSALAGSSLRVQVLHSSGAALTQRRFPLARGSLRARDARQLADWVALTLGGKQRESRRPVASKVEQPPAEEVQTGASLKEQPPTDAIGAEERRARLEPEMAEAHTTSETVAKPAADLEVEAKSSRPSPPLLHAQLTGTTTWRSYCSRPGFTSCAKYNAVDPALRPPGDTVDFRAEVPYMGFSLAADFFPFAASQNLLRGIGVLAGYERGFSLTNVSVQTPAGNAGVQQVYAADQALTALASFRYFFALGHEELLTGYAGAHAGLGARRFDVDSNPQAPLPGSRRTYPVVGLDASVPVFKFLRFDASGDFFVRPTPSSSEVSDYGSTASSSGWSAQLAAAGDIWRPFGYVLRLKYSQYRDQFAGAGAKWQSGGAAEENYVGIYWGATAQF